MSVAVMGIINVTPDSFSDGGENYAPPDAITRAHQLIDEGATILDIGGESTRPGSNRIDADTEIARITPVVKALADTTARLSVDTLHAKTAAVMLDLGVHIINDVSGGLFDSQMFSTLAHHPHAHYVLGHWRATPETMNAHANYHDVLAEVSAEMARQVAAARACGVHNIVLDPGIGFAKNAEHNWQLLTKLGELRSQVGAQAGITDLDPNEQLSAAPLPVMVGVSRKRFLARFSRDEDAASRDLATALISAQLASQRPWALRVHNVAASVAALQIAECFSGGDQHG